MKMEQPMTNPENMFNLEHTGFHKLSSEIRENVQSKTRTVDPIIPKVFEKLLYQCLENFNFTENPVLVEDYFHFYQEVNRLFPSLPQKIVTQDVYGPVFFVGDTHGAIQESYLIIDFFFKVMELNHQAKLVFVGDYVDRNPNDLENLTLITAFSILCPDNVFLIRGNHEDRVINTHYGFLDNLLRTYRDKGDDLYSEILQFFTHLPLGHISQMHSGSNIARVFTVHGGIPIDPHNFMEPLILSELEPKLECEFPESNDMDPYSVSILWSDPDEMIQGILTGESFDGRMKFGTAVFDEFMRANKLDLMVRGHQKWVEGSKTFFNGRLYSLFSTASYDGRIQFSPKILMLEYGISPKLIPVTVDSLNRDYLEIETSYKLKVKSQEGES